MVGSLTDPIPEFLVLSLWSGSTKITTTLLWRFLAIWVFHKGENICITRFKLSQKWKIFYALGDIEKRSFFKILVHSSSWGKYFWMQPEFSVSNSDCLYADPGKLHTCSCETTGITPMQAAISDGKKMSSYMKSMLLITWVNFLYLMNTLVHGKLFGTT